MGGGSDVTYVNPGSQRVSDVNPEVGSETDYLRNLRDTYHSQYQQALSPALYDQRAGRAQEQSRNAIQNRYAQSGLAQSSASYGAQQQSDISIKDQFDRQRINDMLNAMKTESALSGQITGNIFHAQSQFGQAQSQANQAVLQQNANEQAMWGQIIGAGAMIGGTMLAGPAGGMMAGGLAGSMNGAGGGAGTGQMSMPSYNSYDYGNQMYGSAMNNYGYMQ